MAVVEAAVAVVLLIGLALFTSSSTATAAGSVVQWREKRPRVLRVGGVTYDHRALVLNGSRRVLLFSGEIHYPRSTPEVTEMSMCNMVAAAVLAALTALCTVPVAAEGRWREERVRRDVSHDARALVVDGERRMLFAGEIHYTRSTPEMWPKLIAKAKEGGLDVIQTYVFWNVHEPIQGQYNFEGRYDLVKFIREIQAQGLYIENEYQMVEQAFGSSGQRYVSWAAAMAVNLQTGVPWTMCKQNDAPDPIIVPASRYLIYGNDTKLRSPEDIAFAVALFIARKNGSYVSYYMYHGGTNFGRFASSYVTTSYYDGAPLDEYDCNQVVFETSKVNAQRGSRSVKEVQSFNDVNTWKAFKEPIPQDATFPTPTGSDAVTLNLTSMGKGEVWINGESIGRYWVFFKAPSGNPSQSLYHIPRQFFKPQDNLLVLFEEMGGDPQQITVNTVSITKVCGNVNELSASPLLSEEKEPSVHLSCQEGKYISAIEFASYGNPMGGCISYGFGSCHAGSSESVVKQACLGKSGCSIPVTPTIFGGDPCPTIEKSLLVVASCR
ncbi:hypothetical protein PR202_ga04750 [Eleusine coracana subsp. coracana]|uniref:beta-galactosidase n=1 Tax=Eleusine coracana subsp. coracana TaxID=191504 RepID=A0AAV5BRS8_ELECO|nr:hypothetical protein PR202_ga04750 [Eleusine coracana subsp. coracana]